MQSLASSQNKYDRLLASISKTNSTTDKRKRRKQLEVIIRDSYYRQGEAFKEILEQKLYKPEYKSFDAYCRQVWGHTRDWAYKLIRAAKVGGDILQVNSDASLPLNARQAVELSGLTGEEAELLLRKLSKNKLSAKSIRKARQSFEASSSERLERLKQIQEQLNINQQLHYRNQELLIVLIYQLMLLHKNTIENYWMIYPEHREFLSQRLIAQHIALENYKTMYSNLF